MVAMRKEHEPPTQILGVRPAGAPCNPLANPLKRPEEPRTFGRKVEQDWADG